MHDWCRPCLDPVASPLPRGPTQEQALVHGPELTPYGALNDTVSIKPWLDMGPVLNFAEKLEIASSFPKPSSKEGLSPTLQNERLSLRPRHPTHHGT